MSYRKQKNLKWMRGTFMAASVLAVCPAYVLGDWEVPNPEYAAPGSYYNAAVGTGTVLQGNLNAIISNMTMLSYGNSRYAYSFLDADPDHPGNLLEVYTGQSVDGTWDAGITYNREHLWPKYWLNVTSDQVSNAYKGPASDLFELRPTNPSVNSSRSNNGYGYYLNTSGFSGGTYGNNSATVGSATSTFWFPSIANAGEVSRAMFYMATRYIDYVDKSGGGTLGTHTLTLVNGQPTDRYTMGDLQSFLHWNYMYGVDNNERARNQAIYSQSFFDPSDNKTVGPQGNRNPFVDHPEWVWTIFGDHKVGSNVVNNSQISVDTPASDGTSMKVVNVRLLQNGVIPTGSITINKSGADPTTYDISSAGGATLTQVMNVGTVPTTFSFVGTGQPMDYGNVTKTYTLGLTASTATIGLKSGVLTINNTDLTTAAAGQGSLDGNDTVTINASVLQKRVVTPELSTVAFGRVITTTAVAGTITLSTTLDDNSATRVNVSGTATDGILSTTGPSSFFNSPAATAQRILGGTFTSAGAKAGALSFGVTTGEVAFADGAYPSINVNYTATALDHAQASLAATAGVAATTLNFGITVLNAGDVVLPFSVYNVQNTASFTATFVLDSISAAGSTALFSTNAVSGTTLNAGGSLAYSGTFHPTTAGSNLSATYTLNTSEEQIPGAYAPGSKPLQLTLTGTVLPNATWKSTAGVLWSDDANWYGDAPSSSGAVATLSTYGTARTITLSAPVTLGTLQIDSPAGYTLQGTGPLILQGGSSVSVQIFAGTHTLSAPLQASMPVGVDVASGSALVVTGSVTATQLIKTNAGVLTLPGVDAGLDVQGGRVNVTGASHFPSLTVSAGAVLNLAANNAVVDSITPAADLARLTALLALGRNGGMWDGADGITSSTAAHGGGPELTELGIALNSQLPVPFDIFAGVPVTGDSILIKYTYAGDADLNGLVNIDDYLAIDVASISGGTGWVAGDFNYDGSVNAMDYALMDTAFLQQGGPLAQQIIQLHLAEYGAVYADALSAVAVPEPASLMLLLGAMAGLGWRRRRLKPV